MSSSTSERRLSDLMGLELHGWNLNASLSKPQVQKMSGILYQHGLLCFPNQNLTPKQFAEFGKQFGEPILHNEKALRLKGNPTVMSLSNADDRDDRQLNGGAHWHTDLVFTDQPASFTMLNAIEVPRTGGGTMFANQVAAYEALSELKQREIDAYVVRHCYEGRTDGSMPTVTHPLVRAHPITGQKVLYGAWDTGIGIVGMPDHEGRQILQQIARHATDERFVYLHRYLPHDLVIWDNALLLHSAEKLERALTVGDQRTMHRVSVRGWPAAS